MRILLFLFGLGLVANVIGITWNNVVDDINDNIIQIQRIRRRFELERQKFWSDLNKKIERSFMELDIMEKILINTNQCKNMMEDTRRTLYDQKNKFYTCVNDNNIVQFDEDLSRFHDILEKEEKRLMALRNTERKNLKSHILQKKLARMKSELISDMKNVKDIENTYESDTAFHLRDHETCNRVYDNQVSRVFRILRQYCTY